MPYGLIYPGILYVNEIRSLIRYNIAGRIKRMRSLNKLNKNHPEKKKTGPAVKKESHKSGVSLADKKKPKNKKVVGKAEPQHKKKEAPIIKAKPSKNPVHTAAVKKQPVKGKPAGKAAQQSKKKEAPVVKGRKGGREREAKAKTFETKIISFEMDQPSEKKDVIVTEKIETHTVMGSSVNLGKRYKCYKCGIKFYDLGKPQPLCPSCGANQLDGCFKRPASARGNNVHLSWQKQNRSILPRARMKTCTRLSMNLMLNMF